MSTENHVCYHKQVLVISDEIRKKLDIKDESVFAMTEKRLIVLKKINQKLSQDDCQNTSTHEAWQEIESGKGKTKTSKFFAEFAKW